MSLLEYNRVHLCQISETSLAHLEERTNKSQKTTLISPMFLDSIYTYNCTYIYLFTSVFNIDNNKKCFLSRKSAYYNDFWRIMWHWRLVLWSESSAFHLRNKLNLTINSHRKHILNCNNISQYYSFCCIFLSNKCSYGEHNKHLSKPLKIWIILTSILVCYYTFIICDPGAQNQS